MRKYLDNCFLHIFKVRRWNMNTEGMLWGEIVLKVWTNKCSLLLQNGVHGKNDSLDKSRAPDVLKSFKPEASVFLPSDTPAVQKCDRFRFQFFPEVRSGLFVCCSKTFCLPSGLMDRRVNSLKNSNEVELRHPGRPHLFFSYSQNIQGQQHSLTSCWYLHHASQEASWFHMNDQHCPVSHHHS